MDAYSEQGRARERLRADPITRREAIERVTLLLGGAALVGGSALLDGCAFDRPRELAALEQSLFTHDEVALLDEIADTILPETDTPGAKAAATGAFMALSVADVYSLDDQDIFLAGMATLQDECVRIYAVTFMQATPVQRLALLERFDHEAKEWMDARAAARRDEPSPLPDVTADSPAHWFRMMKELALLGYFTSEIGHTRAMRYVETPGRFDPCTPHEPGERFWAPHA